MNTRICFLLAVMAMLSLTACSTGEPAASQERAVSSMAVHSITKEEAVELVREKLIVNSKKLCPNEEGLNALAQLTFSVQGETTVEERDCYVVLGGSTSFAIAKDGTTLYEWEPVSGTYVFVSDESDGVVLSK